MFNPEL